MDRNKLAFGSVSNKGAGRVDMLDKFKHVANKIGLLGSARPAPTIIPSLKSGIRNGLDGGLAGS